MPLRKRRCRNSTRNLVRYFTRRTCWKAGRQRRKAESPSTRENKRQSNACDRPASLLFNPMKERVMPFVEVFTRENLSDEIRGKLAEELAKHMMTGEIGGPSESAKMIDWMWFHVMPADSWAVGGRFDDTYVKGRKMALARILAPP